MPLDHASFTVPQSKLDPLVSFLNSALGPIGIKEMMRPIPTAVGIGDVVPFFWINCVDAADENEEVQIKTSKKAHFAFTVKGKLSSDAGSARVQSAYPVLRTVV